MKENILIPILRNGVKEQILEKLGNGFKKQEFPQEYYCFLVEQLQLGQQEGRNKLYFLHIGRNRIVHQENKNILDDSCFVFPFPGKNEFISNKTTKNYLAGMVFLTGFGASPSVSVFVASGSVWSADSVSLLNMYMYCFFVKI